MSQPQAHSGNAHHQGGASGSGSGGGGSSSRNTQKQHSNEGPQLDTMQRVLEATLSVQRMAELKASEIVSSSSSSSAAAAAAEASGSAPSGSSAAGPSASSSAEPMQQANEVETGQQLQQSFHRLHLEMIQQELAPALAAQARSNKGRGGDVFADAHTIQGKDPIQHLDPSLNSLTMLYLLSARLWQVRKADQVSAIRSYEGVLANFCATADVAQCRLAPGKVDKLFRAMRIASETLKDPTWPLRNMFLFFRRYDPGHGVLTALHPIVLYQCLGARAYSEAHDVLLRDDMQRAPRKAMELAPQDVLEYFYLGALVLTKLQMFGRAIEFFEQCIVLPSTTISALQLDAIKKRLLVQLIKDGKTTDLPLQTSERVRAGARNRLAPYHAFAHAYESKRSGVAHEVLKVAHGDAKTFEEDDCTGLVQQCLERHRRRRIQKLGSMFSAISLQDLHASLGEGDSLTAEHLQQEIQQAHADGWINVRIASAPDSPSPYIYFDAAPPSAALADSASTTRKLTSLMQEVKVWQDRVEDQERQIAKSDAFLHKLAKQARADPRAGFGGAMGVELDEDSAFAP